MIILSNCSDNYRSNKHILLAKKWKFKTGDSMVYAKVDYDDSDWDSIDVLHHWEDLGRIYRSYDGYAWYRTKVFIPASLMQKNAYGDSLKIFLGWIDDCDQVFLNGVFIGENNRTINAGTEPAERLDNKPGAAGVERKYVISVNEQCVRWNDDNILAVRVMDQGGAGGIYTEAALYISKLGLEDFIHYNKDSFYRMSADSIGDTTLTLFNRGVRKLDGELTVSARNMGGDILIYNRSFPCTLKPKEKKKIPMSFPVCTDSVKVLFSFRDFNTKTLAEDQMVLPYILIR